MPMYRKCSHCGRKVLVGQKCSCEREYKKQYAKHYDKNVRNNSDNVKYTKFYNSTSWRKKSKHIQAKYNNLCLVCLLREKKISYSDMVHHIETLKDSWEKRIDDNNLIPLCHECHNEIDHINYTEKEKNELRNLLKEYRKIYID